MILSLYPRICPPMSDLHVPRGYQGGCRDIWVGRTSSASTWVSRDFSLHPANPDWRHPRLLLDPKLEDIARVDRYQDGGSCHDHELPPDTLHLYIRMSPPRIFNLLFVIGLFPLLTRIALGVPLATPPASSNRIQQKNSAYQYVPPRVSLNHAHALLAPRTKDYGVLPMHNLEPGWELDFYGYNWGYLPVTTASYVLEAFYRRVIEIASTTTDAPPEHSVIRWGNLDLEIVSNGMIEWVSVAHFARHMLETAKRGYTNSYHCHMSNAAAGLWVSFNLYVQARRQLPGAA